MKKSVLLHVNILFIVFVSLLISCQEENPEVRKLRELRSISNEAVKNHDAAKIATQWSDDFALFSSSGERFFGKNEMRSVYETDFRELPDVIYERIPDKFDLMIQWGMASEHGSWNGSFTLDGHTYKLGGIYSARWVKTDEEWKISSEYYTPSLCSGGPMCDEPRNFPFQPKFHHVMLYVNDMESSVNFYKTTFGLTIDNKFQMMERILGDSVISYPVNITFLKFPKDNLVLELIEVSEGDSIFHTTNQHIGFTIENIEQTWKLAIENGATERREPGLVKAGELTLKNAFLKGPDGESLELMEWH